ILEIGSHSKTHPDLTNLNSNEEFKKEIKDPKVEIEKMINHEVTHFNYPAGAHNNEVIERVKKYGYKSAVTTIHGFNDENTDLYHLKRIEAPEDFLLFKSSISGSFLTMYHIKDFLRSKK
ncbi:MAG: polysaccharide deacetylase family protein, partial [Thermoplasmatales archaeon]